MWDGCTIQQACELMRIDYADVSWHLNAMPDMKSMLVDTSLLAGAREEILNASHADN
jgi:hypothetical protein